MVQKPSVRVNSYRQFFITVFIILLSSIILFILLSSLYPHKLSYSSIKKYESFSIDSLNRVAEVTISDAVITGGRNPKCSYYDCFNIYKCGHKGTSKILIYVYPFKKYVDDKGIPVGQLLSKEFYLILKTITESEYFTPNPDEACVFVPSIDTLNQNRFRPKEVSQALSQLPYWNGGENHLIFNMIPGTAPDYSTVVDLAVGSAMIAGAGFDTWTYRIGFDISLPVFSIQASSVKRHPSHPPKRKWLVISTQVNIHPDYLSDLEEVASGNSDLLLLNSCPLDQATNTSVRCSPHTQKQYNYPNILQRGVFCLVLRGARLAQPALLDALAAGCIPIVSADTMVMPFTDVLDWRRAVITLGETDLSQIISVAERVSDKRREEMREQGLWLYSKYFSTIEKLTKTTLDILNYRVYPHTAALYKEWNNPPEISVSRSPLFLDLTAPKWQGFTAVILTYDRVQSLFTLIEKLSQVPSLSKIVVVWNHQTKSPPHSSLWPKVSKPLQVIPTKENKLSNRFYPYDEIETEAILSIDDDIVMLTSDELEFGYEVWREFPDRIVGFPSRIHVWDNATMRWKYESEWTNHISMVLTGAAFHHKYWSYIYTTALPGDIKEWVDEHMNCEDIAMNFLVANLTSKAPIKVTPRKKFKCPECTNTEMLSADLNHMVERSHCIDRFADIFGTMPLRSVEFRADPVLYKDPFPEKLKRFNNIGSL